MEQDPRYDNWHCLCGLSLYKLGRHAEAVESCDAALRLNPGNAAAARIKTDAMGGLGV